MARQSREILQTFVITCPSPSKRLYFYIPITFKGFKFGILTKSLGALFAGVDGLSLTGPHKKLKKQRNVSIGISTVESRQVKNVEMVNTDNQTMVFYVQSAST